jgi:hypothetical protein
VWVRFTGMGGATLKIEKNGRELEKEKGVIRMIKA